MKRQRHKMETRSKTKRKEDKSKTTNLNTENITLEELIVKKNKNYVRGIRGSHIRMNGAVDFARNLKFKDKNLLKLDLACLQEP